MAIFLYNPANLTYGLFIGIGVLLFLLVIIGGLQDDSGDFDTDADIDTETDIDLSFLPILGWMGIGKAPLLIVLATDISLWGLFGLILNVLLGSLIGQIPSGFLGTIVFVGSLFTALFSGSLIAKPIGKIFESFGEDASSDRLIGCIGTVTSARIPLETEGKIGQVDVLDNARNLVTISAALPNWATVIPGRGQKVIIIDRQTKFYLVIANDSSDRERWLGNSTKPRNSH